MKSLSLDVLIAVVGFCVGVFLIPFAIAIASRDFVWSFKTSIIGSYTLPDHILKQLIIAYGLMTIAIPAF